MWGMRNGFVLSCLALILVAVAARLVLHEDPLPPIAADLPGASVDANQVLNARVAEAFPLDSSVAKMRSELEQQGFALDQAIVPGWTGSAQIVHKNLLCTKVWFIEWKANGAGRVRDTNGSYGGQCIWD